MLDNPCLCTVYGKLLTTSYSVLFNFLTNIRKCSEITENLPAGLAKFSMSFVFHQ